MSPGCPSMWTCSSPHVAPAPPCMFYPLFPMILLCSLMNRSPNTFTQATATTPPLHHTCTSRHWGPLMNKKVTISPHTHFQRSCCGHRCFFSLTARGCHLCFSLWSCVLTLLMLSLSKDLKRYWGCAWWFICQDVFSLSIWPFSDLA